MLPLDQMTDPQKRAAWFTHKPFCYAEADRTIDHIFVSKNTWKVAGVTVVKGPTWLSDHAPIVATLEAVAPLTVALPAGLATDVRRAESSPQVRRPRK